MQNEKTYSDALLTLVKTRDEANLLYSEIEELEKTIFKTDPNIFNTTLQSGVRATTANFINSAMAGQDKAEFFKNIKEVISSLAYIELKIAFEPTMETLYKLSDWTRKNINPMVCLDIKIDKRILGGVVITYNGKFKDYSLVNEIDAYFETAKLL